MKDQDQNILNHGSHILLFFKTIQQNDAKEKAHKKRKETLLLA